MHSIRHGPMCKTEAAVDVCTPASADAFTTAMPRTGFADKIETQ